MDSERITRIEALEAAYDRVKSVIDTLENALQDMGDIDEDIDTLVQYEESGLWLADYEADERGELPGDLKRGILAQDALYDLFDRISSIQKMLFPEEEEE